MDQSKLIGMIANDVSNENTEAQTPSVNSAKEIRQLSDFELVIASGGDSVIIW